MLHGTSGDGEIFYNISGWKELGEKENFVTVFPSSLTWCFVDNGVEVRDTRWVCGSVIENPCSGPPQNYIDDVKFLKLLVSKIIDTLPINKSKIFASGFSNGSHMIHKLAMDAGDVFAAVAGSGAALANTDSVNVPVKRIPIWSMFGNKEPGLLIPPHKEVPFGGDSVLVYLQDIFIRVLTCQGLTESFTKNETPLTKTYIFNESQPMITSSPYLFTLVKNMIHIYPNGTNFPLDAPKLFWEFFNQSTMTNTYNEDPFNELISIYPNPSSANIRIQFHTINSIVPFQFKVLNTIGQIIHREDIKMETEFEFNKKEIGAGLFVFQFQFGNKIINKTVILQ